jgi:hypothetical protein
MYRCVDRPAKEPAVASEREFVGLLSKGGRWSESGVRSAGVSDRDVGKRMSWTVAESEVEGTWR